MSVTPSESYQRAAEAHNIFQFWLAQQGKLPDDISRDRLIDMLESAHLAGYMEGSK